MALDIREIPLGPNMTKFHFQQPGIPAMHQIRAADPEGDFHDHPFGMESFVLFGGYREEILNPDGTTRFEEHRKGESFHISARRIHRIVELFEDESWTITLPGEFVHEWSRFQVREDGFFRIVNGAHVWQKMEPEDLAQYQPV